MGLINPPNIILILDNKDEEIKGLIGQLCNWAYYGTQKRKKNILHNFLLMWIFINEFKLEGCTNTTSKVI
jgi:hypothetical protein